MNKIRKHEIIFRLGELKSEIGLELQMGRAIPATWVKEQENLNIELEQLKEATKRQTRKTLRRANSAEDWWWKQVQNQADAKRRGHIRRGVECADINFGFFSLDVTTAKAPKKLFDEMRDAEAHASSSETALVAWHRPNEDMQKGIICLRVSDFLELHIA